MRCCWELVVTPSSFPRGGKGAYGYRGGGGRELEVRQHNLPRRREGSGGVKGEDAWGWGARVRPGQNLE